MFTLHRLMTWLVLVLSPARMVAALPLTIIPLSATAHSNVPYNLTLDTSTPSAVSVQVAPQPDFDRDVVVPLRAAQAAEAAQAAQTAAAAKAAALARHKAVQATPVAAPAGDDAFAQLRYCEAGGDYTRNSGNGYYGAYQYSLSTWNGFGGFARPDLAPASVQDARAHADVARRGWSAWPACARKLGLL